jgi:hypothetical protein
MTRELVGALVARARRPAAQYLALALGRLGLDRRRRAEQIELLGPVAAAAFELGERQTKRRFMPRTLFAVFGIASRPGRFVDRCGPYTLYYPVWLDDIAYANGVADAYRQVYDKFRRQRSPAAAAIIEHGLERCRGRRVALTEAARLALIGYYREEAALLGEIAALDEKYRHHPEIRRLHRRHIQSHRRGCDMVLQMISEHVAAA